MFELMPSLDCVGITEMGEIEIPPALVVRRFGLPAKGDGYKVSGQYIFGDEQQRVFVVHDWKSTNLWDSSLSTPEQFWAMEEPMELSVSTQDVDPREFQAWFMEEVGN